MRTKIMLIALILLTSGCVDEYIEPTGTNGETGEGLEINEFSISDDELREGQYATLQLEVTNHNQEIDFESIELDHSDRLITDNRNCVPEPEQLQGATEDYSPSMTCTWDVEPELEEGFTLPGDRVTESITLRKSYEASLENREPLSLEFRAEEDIRETQVRQIEFSNGEIEVEAFVEEPIPIEGDSVLDVTAQNAGNGRLEDDIGFDYSPGEIADDCPSSQEILMGDQVSFTCSLESDDPGSRNLFISTDYKYVEEPVLDVDVVDR